MKAKSSAARVGSTARSTASDTRLAAGSMVRSRNWLHIRQISATRVLDDSYASLGDTVASSLDAMDSTYQSTANLLGSMCKTSSGKASLRVIMHTQSGQSLYDKTWTEK